MGHSRKRREEIKQRILEKARLNKEFWELVNQPLTTPIPKNYNPRHRRK